MKKTCLYLLALFTASAVNAQFQIGSLATLVKNANPGDTIRIPSGSYKDAQLTFTGKGQNGKPIVIMAEKPGDVILFGNSFVKIGGEYLEINGIHFTNGYAAQNPVIEFRKGNDQLANNCRVTNCAITNYSRPERFNTDSWIVLWGKNNRVDHCTIGDKLNGGTTLIVNLDDERSQNNHHSIDSNYFDGRSRLGSNGGEMIRVGVSRYSLTSSRTNIHHNFFDRCNGEVEIISIKSGENIVSRNTFFECEGGLVLRHGSNNTVEGNIFIGNNKPYTGGVRVINPGHKVYNNLFVDLAGDRFRSALGVLNGVPNSALNRYYQVANADIYNNTFVNVKSIIFGAGKDAERTLPPENVSFRNNFISAAGPVLYEDANNNGGIRFSNNIYTGNAKRQTGFASAKPHLFLEKKFRGKLLKLPMHTKAGARLDSLSWIADEAGANWFRFVDTAVSEPTIIGVTPPDSKSLPKLISQAPDRAIIELTGGMYEITEPIFIDRNITIRSTAKQRSELVNVSEKGLPAFIIIQNGGSLVVDGIKFNSAYKSYGDAQSAIATTTKPMNQHYSLTVNNCEFINFNESNFSCIRATKSTYADDVKISNSIFRNNSGTAIDFSAEKEDKGIYNVEKLIVQNCVFANNLSTAINIYRGGNDESTTGPTVVIDYCTFSEVDNREQGCVIKLIGVQSASVTNSVFNKSGAGGRSIWFEEMSWDNLKVDYCNFYQSGRVGSFYNKVLGRNIYNLQPQFVNPANYNLNIKQGTGLSGKSSSGKSIGASL